MSHYDTYYSSPLSRVISNRNRFLNLKSTASLLLAVSIVIGVIAVIFVPISEASAQLLPRRTNDSSTDNDLLSMLLNPGANRSNLSSVADTMFEGIEERIDARINSIEERIDARLNSIKLKLDEIAAVALPLVIASVLGIVILASLIVAFILISWYDRFKISRKNRRDFKNMSEHVLVELKDNMELLRQRSSTTKPGGNGNLDEVDNQKKYIMTGDLSAAAIKASIISPHFWNLSSSAQNVTLKLESLIDKYNTVTRRINELRDYIVLNKLEKETADNMSKGHEETLEGYARDINHLSQQLTELIRTQSHKGIIPSLRSRQKENQ
jgi:hypothetical protein